MNHLVFLLEEESAKAFIDNLLPRIFPDLSFICISFEGKQDLEKNIPIKLRGFRTPNTKFIILRDEDSGDCKVIKENLQLLCYAASKPDTLIRIACKELESWYFGDLKAVEIALKIKNITHYSNKRRFKVPDLIVNPKKELKSLSKNKYNQISGSREIGKHIDYQKNTSHSFNVFLKGIKTILEI